MKEEGWSSIWWKADEDSTALWAMDGDGAIHLVCTKVGHREDESGCPTLGQAAQAWSSVEISHTIRQGCWAPPTVAVVHFDSAQGAGGCGFMGW